MADGHAAIAYTLIETAKLNRVDSQGWLADTLARIPDYEITRVDDLLSKQSKRPRITPQNGYGLTNNDHPNMGIGGITPAMKLKMAA